MAQSTRIFGAHIDVFTVAATEYAGSLGEIECDYELATQIATALKDTSEYPIGIRDRWSFTGSRFPSSTAGGTEGAVGLGFLALALAKAQVALVLEIITGAIANAKITGNGLFTRNTVGLPDGPDTERFTITGQGALTLATSS